MKTVIVAFVSAFLGLSNFAQAGTFKGKCAGPALSAAIEKWADVPNPAEDLFYVPVSATPAAARSTSYQVTLGIYDLNEYMAYDKFVVEFADLKTCTVVSVERAD